MRTIATWILGCLILGIAVGFSSYGLWLLVMAIGFVIMLASIHFHLIDIHNRDQQ